MRLGYSMHNFSINGLNEPLLIDENTTAKDMYDSSESLLIDLHNILIWNTQHDIFVYRMPYYLFPYPTVKKIPEKLLGSLQLIGTYIKENDIRVTFHASHKCVMSSLKSYIRQTSANELNFLASIMDAMGLDKTPYYKINIHVGSVNDDMDGSIETFISSLSLLNDSALSRLTIENDDTKVGYKVEDLHKINKRTNIPIVFDYYHNKISTSKIYSEKECLQICKLTWDKVGIKQIVHYTSGKKVNEDFSARLNKHADYVFEEINTYGLDLDIMLESAACDLALFKYRKDFIINN
jgi:UV DNA damage endonuclease